MERVLDGPEWALKVAGRILTECLAPGEPPVWGHIAPTLPPAFSVHATGLSTLLFISSYIFSQLLSVYSGCRLTVVIKNFLFENDF